MAENNINTLTGTIYSIVKKSGPNKKAGLPDWNLWIVKIEIDVKIRGRGMSAIVELSTDWETSLEGYYKKDYITFDYYFTAGDNYTSQDISFAITTGRSVTIGLASLKKVPDIGHGEPYILGDWSDGSVTLNADLSEMVGDVQDATTYAQSGVTEVITISSSGVTLTAGDRDQDYYVTKDFGADHFGDFNHWVDVNVTAQTDAVGSRIYFWALSNADDDLKDIDDASGDFITLLADRLGTGYYRIRLFNCNGGTLTEIGTPSGSVDVGTEVFIKPIRTTTTMSVGIYSTNALRIAGGTPDISTISGTVVGTKFQYVYYIGSYNNGITALDISGTVSNLRINEVSDGYMIPASLTDWTSSGNVGPYVVMNPSLITSGTLTLGTEYFVNATEIDHFGSGVTNYNFFTSDGTEVSGVSNAVYATLSSGAQWAGAGTLTQAGILTSGKSERIAYDLTRTAGTFYVLAGTAQSPARTLTGSYVDYLLANGTNLTFSGDATFAGILWGMQSGVSTIDLRQGNPLRLNTNNKVFRGYIGR